MNIKEYYTSSGCSTNVQYCPKTCIPKLKYFGITDDMVSCVEKDDLGNIKTLCISADHPNPPKLTVKDYKVMYYDTINKEYVDFDSTLYDNIYVKAYKDNVYGDSSSYSISIEPANCAKISIISNVTLYRPSDYYIKSVSNDGGHIELSKPISEKISSILNDPLSFLTKSDKEKYFCQKSFFFKIKQSDIKQILNSDIDVQVVPNSNFIQENDSIILRDNIMEKPYLIINGGSLQYLDENGLYKNFEDNLYQNVQLQLFNGSSIANLPNFDTFLGVDSDIFQLAATLQDDLFIRILQKDIRSPMILADKALFPFQNYVILDILDDGTIIQLPIQNSFSGLLG